MKMNKETRNSRGPRREEGDCIKCALSPASRRGLKTCTVLLVCLHFLAFGGTNAIDDREGALLRAMASVNNAAERASKDSLRPQFHFRPPGNWMNDPNGPIFHRDYYHMFYQHNPYGDAWGHMHWGHSRSKDLVHWEHLPVALWPSEPSGEKHCFSGCAALNAKGEPMIFYTSIGHPRPECWIALPEDSDLIRWKKFHGNPILTEASPGTNYYDFRDPFVFKHQNRTFMVHGGNLNKAKGGQAVVSLYEAENPELTKWKYRSIPFHHPDPKVVNIECPLFFPLDGKFVLITSPHRACDYFIGKFDPDAGKFTFEIQGMLDHSSQFYAPNCLEDSQGRRILWGWIRGFPERQGWNGCLSVPRILSIRNGRLVQTPAPEVARLRQRELGNGKLPAQAEIEFVWQPEKSNSELPLFEGGQPVRINNGELELLKARIKLPDQNRIQFRIFFDRSVTEVFLNDGSESITRVARLKEGAPFAKMVSDLKVWELKSIW